MATVGEFFAEMARLVVRLAHATDELPNDLRQNLGLPSAEEQRRLTEHLDRSLWSAGPDAIERAA